MWDGAYWGGGEGVGGGKANGRCEGGGEGLIWTGAGDHPCDGGQRDRGVDMGEEWDRWVGEERRGPI